jgi:hypothetical protein
VRFSRRICETSATYSYYAQKSTGSSETFVSTWYVPLELARNLGILRVLVLNSRSIRTATAHPHAVQHESIDAVVSIQNIARESKPCSISRADYFGSQAVYKHLVPTARRLAVGILLLHWLVTSGKFLLPQSRCANQTAHTHRLDSAAGNKHQRAFLFQAFIQHVHRPQVKRGRVVLV